MREQFLDFIIDVLFVLIWGILLLNVFYSLKGYFRNRKARRWFIFLILFAGCLGSQDADDVQPAVPQETPAFSAVPAPRFENTGEGLKEALRSGFPVVVDFNASWCYNCREQGRILEGVKEEHPEIIFMSIDSDRYSGVADEYGVEYLPTIIIFNEGGEPVRTFIGLTEKQQLDRVLNSL
jgi:thiol:disulfide interchange protein